MATRQQSGRAKVGRKMVTTRCQTYNAGKSIDAAYRQYMAEKKRTMRFSFGRDAK